MATAPQKQTASKTAAADSVLEQAIGATKQTERSRAEELLRALAEQAMQGTVTWDRNLSKTIKDAVKKIDEAVSNQLREIVHDANFLKLEGTWRGVYHVVEKTANDPEQKVKLFSASKSEVYKDLSKSLEFDQNEMFKKVYEDEFGTPGGEPYSTLIGDYEFTNHPEDIEFLSRMSEVAAASFCPFISSIDFDFLGFDNWNELSKPKDLARITDSSEYTKWRSFREKEESRFVTLTMPRVLARDPYSPKTYRSDEITFTEVELDAKGKSKALDHGQYCWMNAAYVLAGKMNESFEAHGWPTAMRGAEAGGKVQGLPTHTFKTDDGDIDMKCPTEVAITDRREAELSNMGFLPLSHYKNTDYAVFFGAQTAHKPGNYEDADARANDEIASRLPYNLIAARIAHYLKVIARDKIGSMVEANDIQQYLQKWIVKFSNSNSANAQHLRYKYPLAEAKVEVNEVEGSPGSYNAVAWIKPWLALEELSTSIRLVASIPSSGESADEGGEGGDDAGGDED
tara:strand:+ start:97833 stop:99371 length:1539 start_codon:yes stop_codon:yes gene_type:complete